MSFDLYQKETDANLDRFGTTQTIDDSGFIHSAATATMRGFAESARAASMLLAPAAVTADLFMGGTEIQDRFFQGQDEVYGSAVDFWTPRTSEVSVAGEITGQLLSAIPLLFINPAALVAKTQLSVAEDLSRQGVSPLQAQAVGAVQAAGLGIGIYVPILGKTLAQKVLLGGAGFNVLQGATMRAVSGETLEGTSAAEQFKAFDRTALTLDVLLGAAFGGYAHLSNAKQLKNVEFFEKLASLNKGVSATEIDALATLRQTQHLNADSLPGEPAGPADIDAHVNRMKKALEQTVRDEPVNITDLPKPDLGPDAARMVENTAAAEKMTAEAERIRTEENLPRLIEGDIVGERRIDPETRKRVAEMTMEEREKALLTHEMTGIPNHRAYGEAPKLPVQIAIDADSLGWVNDNMGHASGNVLLKTVAKALHEESGNAFHIHGDEFLAQAMHNTDADEVMARVTKRLESTTIEVKKPDGTIVRKTGLGVSYGKGKNLTEADRNLYADKAERRRAGLRPAGKEAEPPGVARIPPKGVGDREHPSAAKESAQDPLVTEARRIVAEQPDLQIAVGHDADGTLYKSAQQILDESLEAAKLARRDAELFKVAVGCILGSK